MSINIKLSVQSQYHAYSRICESRIAFDGPLFPFDICEWDDADISYIECYTSHIPPPTTHCRIFIINYIHFICRCKRHQQIILNMEETITSR